MATREVFDFHGFWFLISMLTQNYMQVISRIQYINEYNYVKVDRRWSFRENELKNITPRNRN